MTTATTLPLKPLSTERRAGIDVVLARRPDIEALATRVVSSGLRNVFLTGSGGGLLTHTPAHYLLERGTAAFPTFAYSASELIYREPVGLGAGSLLPRRVEHRDDPGGGRGREVRAGARSDRRVVHTEA